MKSYHPAYSLPVIIVMLIINGCNPKMIPLKGQYPTTALEITSTKSIDSIWGNIAGLFSANGLLVKKIDRKKGLITSAKSSFTPVYTLEDKDGQLQEPQAWVVLSRVINNSKEWNPTTIYGQWSIQVTEAGKGIATIKIDPIVNCTYHPNFFVTMEARGRSTGKLEELIKISLMDSFK
jgi:hypothetical protein